MLTPNFAYVVNQFISAWYRKTGQIQTMEEAIADKGAVRKLLRAALMFPLAPDALLEQMLAWRIEEKIEAQRLTEWSEYMSLALTQDAKKHELHHATLNALPYAERLIAGLMFTDGKVRAPATKAEKLGIRRYWRMQEAILNSRKRRDYDKEGKLKENYVMTIPMWINNQPGLTLLQKAIFADIEYLCKLDGGCYKNNMTFAADFGKSESTIQSSLSRWIKVGYIISNRDPKFGQRWLQINRAAFEHAPEV